MTVEEMTNILHDVIDAALEAAPPGLSESELDEFVLEGPFAICHVHDGRLVAAFAGSALLFRCSVAQWKAALDALADEGEPS